MGAIARVDLVMVPLLGPGLVLGLVLLVVPVTGTAGGAG